MGFDGAVTIARIARILNIQLKLTDYSVMKVNLLVKSLHNLDKVWELSASLMCATTA